MQRFGEFLLRARLVKESAAPYCVRSVRQFLARPTANESLADRVRHFCEELERGGYQDWQVRQAEHALQIYFVNFLRRTDWQQQPASAAIVDEQGRVDPLAAIEQLRRRIRTRHYSYRTECSYADWVRRFFTYAAKQQGAPRPRIEPQAIQDYLTHLAVRSTCQATRRIRRSARSCSSAERCSE